MRLFKRLRRKIDYLTDGEISQIHHAYLVALEAHRGQKRRTGEPYITHPVAVACIMADLKMDYQSIMAALLHDVIEDTLITKESLAQQFGPAVANLVDGVSKLTQIEFHSHAEAQAENFQKMVLAMARDIRVILVKLADRLHNMRTLESLPHEKQKRIAKETIEIFAPIAKRLGMRDLSVELEELCFKIRYPRRHAILKESVRRARGNRKKVLHLIENALHEGLGNSQVPACTIEGREKHLYSIYRKMLKKHIPFNEIMDVYAFRIIVDDVDTCYRVLGVVHNLFKPVPERFKDYIAIPKVNGYQSLHTTLFGPYGLPIEMQIRTTDMDRMAMSGIAAHWLYKSERNEKDHTQVRAQQWVKNLLELQRSSGSSLEFIESVKVDLFPDEVYVFTPKGDIMELPSGATAIDFAYTVHTDVGNSCVGTKIDRQIAPLSSVLVNGQTIEVITSPNARPNPAWLDFVVTSKARSSIRDYLKSRRQSESIELGEQLLQKGLAEHALSVKKIPERVLDFLLKETHTSSFDLLLEDLGLGNRVPTLVAQHIKDLMDKTESGNFDALAEKTSAPLLITGTEGMVVNFGRCCYPIPGDPIAGVLSSGKGLVVHVERCPRISRFRHHPEQCMALRWSPNVQGEFLVKIQLQVLNQRGVLAILALAVSDADGNIEDIHIEDRQGRHYIVNFKLTVKDRKHLATIMKNLRAISSVEKIGRIRE